MSRPIFDRLEPRRLLTAQLVADLAPGPLDSLATPFATVGDTVFFTANLNNREELWKSDGTEAGTALVSPLPGAPSAVPTDWAVANGHVFFIMTGGTRSTLWASDGTAAGTQPLHDVDASSNDLALPPSDARHVVGSGGWSFFISRPDASTAELWKSDGTPAGTARVKAFDAANVSDDFGGVDVNGTFYFKLGELWKTDGTEAGTAMIDLSPGPLRSAIHSLTNVNGKVVFAGTLFTPGNQILDGVFASDGTAAGTVQLAPVQLKPETFETEVVGNTVYFPGSTTDVNQLQLWESDGTAAGTRPAYEPRPGAANPHYLTKVGDTLFFFVDGGANGEGLWTTDGTDVGTRFVRSANPATGGAPHLYPPGNTAEGHGKFLFVDSAGTLWQSDGSDAGTFQAEGPDSARGLVHAVGGDVFFAGTAPSSGDELWRFDATEPPSSQVVARRMVYNNSAYDGNNPAANAQDDAAIDNRKQPLLPGGTPTFANVTSYTKGINAVTVDIEGLPAGVALTPADFSFRSGTTPDRSTWAAGPEPLSVTVRANVGVAGSDRVTLTWRDYNPLDASGAPQAVANGWLEVTVKANRRTLLAQPDVFYVGNLIGETTAVVSGDVRTADVRDYLATRNLIGSVATIANPFDFNRDKKIDALDVAAARSNLGRSLVLIRPPVSPVSGQSPASALVASASPAATELVRCRSSYRPAL